jgi:hypothetical protein
LCVRIVNLKIRVTCHCFEECGLFSVCLKPWATKLDGAARKYYEPDGRMGESNHVRSFRMSSLGQVTVASLYLFELSTVTYFCGLRFGGLVLL